MKSYAIFEAKNRLSELVASVQNGEEITLTRPRHPCGTLGRHGQRQSAP